MHWMSVKLPDNFQICEHSWPCLFHIKNSLYTNYASGLFVVQYKALNLSKDLDHNNNAFFSLMVKIVGSVVSDTYGMYNFKLTS
jgi:hypothetical protein